MHFDVCSSKKVLRNAKFLTFHIEVILDPCRIPFDAVIVFLSETDFLFKSASTPFGENSQIPIRPRPGINIQENLFSNGPTIQETYSQMGLLSRNVTPTRVSGPTMISQRIWKPEPKSGFRNSKIPKMGLLIQESSQSLHRLLVE